MAWLIILFIVLTDIYAWQALRVMTKAKHPTYVWTVRLSYWILSIGLLLAIMSFFTFRQLNDYKTTRSIIGTIFFIFFGSKLVTCIVLLLEDITRGFRFTGKVIRRITTKPDKVAEKEEDAETKSDKISRAKFISKVGLISAGVPLVILTRGALKGAYNYQVHNVKLPLKNLPSAFEGLKVLQISDVHSGSFINTDAVKAGIDLIKAQQADITFFTGDLVNNRSDEMDPWMDMFSEIKSPMGVYSILGNHDYGDYEKWDSSEAKVANFNRLIDIHKEIGWDLMRDEHRILEKGGHKIGLLGVENWGSGSGRRRFPQKGDLDKARRGIPDVPVKLLLSHDPSHWDAKVRPEHPDINATFSGHTHGMQFGIENKYVKWSPVQYIYKQWAGLYEKEGQQLYVNRGFGFLGFHGRIGILPEITVFELTKA